MRYYQQEHESAYREIEKHGHTQWNDLFDPVGTWTYDHFQNRAFLERALPQLDLLGANDAARPGDAGAQRRASRSPRAFEYGCGTGPAACWLAAQGWQVDAIDLIPEAIAIARKLADDRGVQVAFEVADICTLPIGPNVSAGAYDLVVDSYCLQSIVIDEDRRAVFSAVRARLKPSGYYVISTALRGAGRRTEPGFHYDDATGIYYRQVPAGAVGDQVVELGGRWYVPHRRHLTADALRYELASAGFEVLSLEGSDPVDVICRPVGIDSTPRKAGPL
ncbi:hypothetical protein GCM10027269_10490 [Kribbella endophytica]